MYNKPQPFVIRASKQGRNVWSGDLECHAYWICVFWLCEFRVLEVFLSRWSSKSKRKAEPDERQLPGVDSHPGESEGAAGVGGSTLIEGTKVNIL